MDKGGRSDPQLSRRGDGGDGGDPEADDGQGVRREADLARPDGDGSDGTADAGPRFLRDEGLVAHGAQCASMGRGVGD